MDIKIIADYLKIPIHRQADSLAVYKEIRKNLFRRYYEKYIGTFQSPSVSPTPIIQRANNQTDRKNETYLRYDFRPQDLEEKFNSGFLSVNGVQPQTLFFNSGMSAITTLVLYLAKVVRPKKVLLGDYTFFESKHILRRLFLTKIFSEESFEIPDDTTLVWFDYPTNDDNNYFLNLPKLLNEMIKRSYERYDEEFFIVIDYTVSAFGFSLEKYLKELPLNLHIFLVSSLQKHMTYGLDIGTGGALTIYSRASNIYAKIDMLRSYSGSFLNERSYFLLPPIEPSIVRRVIFDSGSIALEIAQEISNLSSKIIVHYQYKSPEPYTSSLIFVQLGDELLHNSSLKNYAIDSLTKCILVEAKKNNAILVHGTSFGFPMTRIFKNGDIDEDVRILRIVAGYDERMQENVLKSIKDGIQTFLKINQ